MSKYQWIIDEEYDRINQHWNRKELCRFFMSGYDEHTLHSYHYSFGAFIRNHYKLWNTDWTPIIKNGCDISEDHPDAISMHIITEVWKKGMKLEKDLS
jgi:hypothetical protein